MKNKIIKKTEREKTRKQEKKGDEFAFSFFHRPSHLLAELGDELVEEGEQLDARGQAKSLSNGVRVLHIRADADSLDLVRRELVDDDTALKTSVDGHKLGLRAEETLVDGAGSLAKGGVGLSGPSRAVRGVIDLLAAIESSISNDVVGESLEGLVDGGTSKDLNLKRAILLEGGDGDGLGSLHQAGNSLAPLPDTVVKTSDGLQSSASGREGEGLLGGGSSKLLDDHLRINLDLAGGLLEALEDVLHCSDEGISLIGGNRELGGSERGDGVVSVATVEEGKAELCTSHGDVVPDEHLDQPLGGVGAADLDIDTAVATLEVLEGNVVVDEALRVRSAAHGEAEDTVDTTSAAEGDLSPVLRVDVDQVLGLLGEELTLLQAKSTNEADLLIDGEEELNRTMLEGLVSADSEASSDTTAIITTESGVGGAEELAIDVGDERISHEIVLVVSSLGADHIKVSLQDDAGNVLLALGGGDLDANVAELISLHLTADFLTDLLDPLGDLLGVVRRTRDLSQSEEEFPHCITLRVLGAQLLINLLLDVQVQFCHLQ